MARKPLVTKQASEPSPGGEAAPLAAPQRAGRRLILLFDGTWNEVEFGERDTSILRLRELIDGTLSERRRANLALAPKDRPPEDKTYVFYRRGVGTDGWPDRVRGGMLGLGVAENVRRGYLFLARHYQPKDEIFIFGFSRGAFTARSLVGYLGAAGLLRDAWCTPELERAAWNYYRTPPDDRLPGDWHALGAYVHPRETFRVRALCVFDTVGALGVPGGLFRWANRQTYAFHNVELPSITDVNLHAVAIDEQRQPFVATLWREHKFKRFAHEHRTEQVWFPGVHSDIGGGYFDRERRDARLPALDDVPLDWMLRRLAVHAPGFPAPPNLEPAPGTDWIRAAHHDSYGLLYRPWARGHRAIANRFAPVPAGQTLIGRNRHEMMVGEKIHVAAVSRVGTRVPCIGQDAVTMLYAPPVLVARLPDLAAGRIGMVGWDGAPMPPDTARAAVMGAFARLATA